MLVQNKEIKNNNTKNMFKTSSACLQAGLVLLLVIMVLWPIYKIGYPIFEKEFLEYWANARIILGEPYWREFIKPHSDAAYGYSLILAAFGKVFKNSVYLYKAVMACNLLFWVAAYGMMIKIANKIRGRQQEVLNMIACFVVMLLPAYVDAKVLLGPQAMLLLLFLLIVDRIEEILNNQDEKTNRKNIVFVAGLLILGLFLHSSMIAVILGTILFGVFHSWQKKLDERVCLYGITTIAIGVLCVMLLEQGLGTYIWKDQLDYSMGFITMFKEMSNGFDETGLIGILEVMAGRWFTLLTGSIFLVLPGLWWISKKENRNSFKVYLLVTAVTTFIFEAAKATSEVGTTAIFQDDFLWIIMTLIFLGGIYYIFDMQRWHGKVLVWTIVVATSACVVSDCLKRGTNIEFNESLSGIIPLYSWFSHDVTNVPVLIAAILLTLGLVAIVSYKAAVMNNRKVIGKGIILAFCIGLVFLQYQMLQYFVFEKQDSFKEYKEIGKAIEGWNGKTYSWYQDEDMAVMALIQSLCNKEIFYVNDEMDSPEQWEKTVLRLQKESGQVALLLPQDKQWAMDKLNDYRKICNADKMVLYKQGKSVVEQSKKEKVIIGEDNLEELTAVSQIVNEIQNDATLGYVVSKKAKKKKELDISNLIEVMPKMQIDITTIEELGSGRAFYWLILKGYTGEYQALLDDYTIITVEGEYTLLLRKDSINLIEEKKESDTMLTIEDRWKIVWERKKEQQSNE